MYESLGITGKTSLLVAGIYNCTGPLASKSQALYLAQQHTNNTAQTWSSSPWSRIELAERGLLSMVSSPSPSL